MKNFQFLFFFFFLREKALCQQLKPRVALSFFKKNYLFTFGCTGSSLLCVGFLWLRWAGFSLQWLLLLQSTGSRVRGLSSMGLVAPQHVGSSRTRDGSCVPCIGRQVLIHCTTREVLWLLFFKEKKFFAFTLTFTIPGAPYSFVWIHVSIWHHLPSAWRTSCSAALVVMNSLSFCLSQQSLFCLHFWKIFSLDVKFYVDSCFLSSL